MAVLTPALVELRATFNRLNPGRDRSSDGWIGDPAHAASSSDHNPDETGTVPIRDADSTNEVHAIDVDETGPWPADARGAYNLMRAVRQLVEDHRAGRERRLRYIIYERTIWSASWGWTAREYTGSNPHDKHAHFSGSYDTALERDARTWNIGFTEDDMTEDEVRRAAALGVHDALHVASSGTDFNGLPYGSPGAVGRSIRTSLTGLVVTPLLDALRAFDAVDEGKLAAALAPAVAAAVVALLPEDRDDVTVEELTEAFRRAVAGQ